MSQQTKTKPADLPDLPTGIIRRKVPAEVTLRKAEGEATRIEMFIPYDKETRLWWFREVIRPGFFSRAIEEKQDVVAWYAHGEGGQLPLGRTSAKPATLTMNESKKGMTATATPPDTPEARSVMTAIERGEVAGASFAFEMIYDEKGRALGERWVEEPGEDPLRELLDAIIWDVSPVVFPAYTDSDTEVKEQARRAYTEYRATHPAPDQVDTAPGDTNRDDDDQVDDVEARALELAAIGARYRIP